MKLEQDILNKIIKGDCIEKLKELPDESIDLIFADPPYWMRVNGILQRVEGTDYNGCDDEWDKFSSLEDYEKFSRQWISECKRVLKPNGSIWIIGGMQCIYSIGAIMQQIGLWLVNDVVWHKKNPTPNFKGTRLNNSHETLIWANKSKSSRYTFHYKTAKELNHDTVLEEDFNQGVRKQLGSVWRISVCTGNERLKDAQGEKLHSTQKPEELLYRIIAISSNKNDIVLDPFAGTMTTAAMAKKLGRKYIMIEKEEKYIEYGRKRLEAVDIVDDAVANAAFDEKPKKVTMEEMIKANLFKVNEDFYLKNGKSYAQLQDKGKLLYNGSVIDMHTCAALAKQVKASRVNGFDFWYVMRNGNLVSIADIRAKYRDTL